MTTLQKAFIGTTLAAAVATGLYEAQRASKFEEQMQTLQRPSAADAGPNDPLRRQLEEANRQLAALKAQNENLRREAADLPRLRGEVARLREKTSSSPGDPTATAAKSWLARVSQLKERLQQTPGAKIPEFQFLTEQDWLNAAKGELNTDEDYRRAFSGLRGEAESAFINGTVKPALTQYAQANNGQFPQELSQLQPYFNSTVDDSALQRWEVTPKSTVSSIGVGDTIITEIAPVDADYDNRIALGLHGCGTAGPYAWNAPGTDPGTVLGPALQAYVAANNGLEPTDPAQLAPYLTTPEQQAALQKVIKQHNGATMTR